MTEQVYIHSKLLIADDCTAILGSANINDRSLEGDRDSELAVIVHDGDSVSIPMDGKRSFQVSKSVHKLRADLWKKHFGITGGVNPATELADCIDKPADPQTWKKIQVRASRNADSYEDSFAYIPRDESSVQATKTTASIWPTWRYPEPLPGQPVIKVGGAKQGLMPFEPEFWGKNSKTALAPVGVKGFITALPLQWTGSENNNSGFHLTMLAGLLPEGDIQVAAASTPSVATG